MFAPSRAHHAVQVLLEDLGIAIHWGALMAAALFTSVPIAIVYNLFLDRFIESFTMGAVKG